MKIINTKYLSIIKHFWITSIATELEYKFNFLIETLSVFANLAGSIFLLSLFYSDSNELGGWNKLSSFIVLGVYIFLEGFTISFLQPNLNKIVRHVQNGTLDFILLKPIDTQFWLSARIINPWGFPSFISGIFLISYGVRAQNLTFNLIDILYFISLITSALIILYSLWFVIATTSIWFVKVWNANEVLKSILAAGRYPISAFPFFLRTILTFIIPIAFLTTIPAQSLLGFHSLAFTCLSFIFAITSFNLSRIFWLYAMRFYTSASS